VQLEAGTHPDFMAIGVAAGKKEIGVDLVRQLKRMIALHAVGGAHKVAIIDDAERLSIAAQNALLKTLEEPPPGSVLIIVTASPRALLPTVRSRCRLIALRPLPAAQVEAALRENAGLEAEEARNLASVAEGSPGYALQLRDVLGSATAPALERLLADVDPDRYVTVIRLAKALGRTEQEMVTRLQILYARCHALAVRAVRSGAGAATGDAERLSRQAAAVATAIANLQQRNPNRPLLAEAVAVQLARS
jgi:DNA polymerase-3 subunit delta'